MNKNYLLCTLFALLLSGCYGDTGARSKTNTARSVDPSTAINDHTGIITRNVGDRTGVINQSGHNLPRK